MIQTARALVIMLLAPPLALLFWAHAVRRIYSGWDLVAIIVAGLLGLAGAATAPWQGIRKYAAAAVYGLLLIPALPFAGLLAVCSTGDCL
jgi:threonine dehydrogenase-like Zn-dependent dehydrogenase